MSKVAALLQQAATTMAVEQKREAERATRRRYELGDYLARKMLTDPALRERVAVDMNAECTRTSTRSLFELDEEATWFDKLEQGAASAAAGAERQARLRKKDQESSQSQPPADVSTSPSLPSKNVANAPAPALASPPAPRPSTSAAGSGSAKALPAQSDNARAS